MLLCSLCQYRAGGVGHIQRLPACGESAGPSWCFVRELVETVLRLVDGRQLPVQTNFVLDRNDARRGTQAAKVKGCRAVMLV
jgi:hypothetical protein